jgi:hypothetical protein
VSRRREPGFYSFGARGQAFYQKGGRAGLPAELAVTIGLSANGERKEPKKIPDIFANLAITAPISRIRMDLGNPASIGKHRKTVETSNCTYAQSKVGSCKSPQSLNTNRLK